jgi:outer membrane protein
MKMKIVFLQIIMALCFGRIYAQHSLTLDESKELALKNNSESKNSELKIEAAHQQKESAFTKYFPTVSASGFGFSSNRSLLELTNAGGNLPVYDGNPANLQSATQYAYMPSSTAKMLQKGITGSIDVVQTLYAGGRIENSNNLASLDEEVHKSQNSVIRNGIILNTETQYWQTVTLWEKYKTIQKYETFLRNLLLQVKDAFNSGAAMHNDVLKVQLKLSEVLLNKSKLENGIKLSSMSFCQYIGMPYDSLLVLSGELKITDLPLSYHVDHREALEKRSEYHLLEKSVKAEELQTKLKFGEFLPEVSVGLSGSYTKIDDNKGNADGIIYGAVSIPISNWWGGSHELHGRSIEEEIARNNFKNNSELLILQMEKAWQDLSDSYKQYLLSEESKMQAEDNLKVNEDSYKNGLTALSDLLEAQAALQQTCDQLTDAKANYTIKKTTYLQVTGR